MVQQRYDKKTAIETNRRQAFALSKSCEIRTQIGMERVRMDREVAESTLKPTDDDV